MHIDIISLYPEYFSSPFSTGLIGRAIRKGFLEIEPVNLREFSIDGRVDDKPYGGGPGMVLKPEPLSIAIEALATPDAHIIYLTPQGIPLTNDICRELAEHTHLIFLCGHYEGIDERIIERHVDEELSIGDYVLSNGCPAAVVAIDALSRFLPGVLGNPNSTDEETFANDGFEGPQYTRPATFEGKSVPEVLRAGNHQLISSWRTHRAKVKQNQYRPDL